jgi:hypothetical protein
MAETGGVRGVRRSRHVKRASTLKQVSNLAGISLMTVRKFRYIGPANFLLG